MLTVKVQTPELPTNGQSQVERTELCDFAVFDIETAPLDDKRLRVLCPPFEPPPKPGVFEPSLVKVGNLKDPAKIAEKMAAARQAHEVSVMEYDVNAAKAAADHFAKFKESAALDAMTGKVVAIGVSPCPVTGFGLGIIDCDGLGIADEAGGLRMFWQWVAANLTMQRPMIGFNIHGFDLPFLVRRSWLLGTAVPMGVRVGRYWNPLFVDLMRFWGDLDSSHYVSLDGLAKAFGLPGKVEEVGGVAVSGATFYKLWRENRKVAEVYLTQDLALPADLAVRMGAV